MRLDIRPDVVARRQFIVRALTRQERPGTALTPAQKRSAVVPLSVAVVVVSSPAGTHGSFHLEGVIDDFQRIDNHRIVRSPDPVPHQLQKACIHYITRFEVGLSPGTAVVDADFSSPHPSCA